MCWLTLTHSHRLNFNVVVSQLSQGLGKLSQWPRPAWLLHSKCVPASRFAAREIFVLCLWDILLMAAGVFSFVMQVLHRPHDCCCCRFTPWVVSLCQAHQTQILYPSQQPTLLAFPCSVTSQSAMAAVPVLAWAFCSRAILSSPQVQDINCLGQLLPPLPLYPPCYQCLCTKLPFNPCLISCLSRWSMSCTVLHAAP